MDHLPPKDDRTCGLFSATMPIEIQKLASDIMNNHIFMSVGIVGAANKDIDQQFYIVPKKKKVFEVILKFLKFCRKLSFFQCADIVQKLPQHEKILIFVNSKIFADTLAPMFTSPPYNMKVLFYSENWIFSYFRRLHFMVIDVKKTVIELFESSR